MPFSERIAVDDGEVGVVVGGYVSSEDKSIADRVSKVRHVGDDEEGFVVLVGFLVLF